MKFPIPSWERLREIVRFYQAAIINTAFGISAYALLVWLGLNIYVAQAVAQVMGMTFNYFTYSRHVFRGTEPAKLRFAISYAVYYVVALAALAALAQFITSPYAAGIGAALIASLLNYFVLKHLVFRMTAA
jgi:putative flippase GtrA